MLKEDKELKGMQEEAEEMELDLDSLEEVSGGANPFANVKRVKNQQIDSTIKGKI